MRLFLIIIGTLWLSARCLGQLGHEWIDYNTTYWHFPVVQKGLHRISYDDLLQAGMPVSNIHPAQLRLYAKGKMVSLHFIGDSDEVLEQGEYYCAYLDRHRGEMETGAYGLEAYRPDNEYSLFNDTLHHYLTVTPDNGMLMAEIAMPLDTNLPIHTSVGYTVRHALHARYYAGRADNNGVSLPTYDEGEGWFDEAFGTTTYEVDLPLTHRSSAFSSVHLQWKVAGVNSALGIPNHHLQMGVGTDFEPLFDTTFTGHKLIQKHLEVLMDSEATTLNVGFKAINDLGVSSDLMALGSMQCTYQRLPIFSNTAPHEFIVQAIEGTSWTKLPLSLQGYVQPTVYRILGDLVQHLPLVFNGTNWDVYIPWSGELQQQLILVDQNAPLSIVPPTPYTMIDYVSSMEDNQLIIVTHRSLWNAAQNYAVFKQANGHSVLVLDAEQLYHQYGGGVMKNPLAIRRCMEHAFSSGIAPGHLFIIGKSIHESPVSGEAGARNTPTLYERNLVPTWGNPGSDALYTAGLNGTLYEPAIPTGRLAAANSDDVLNYLNKVVEHSLQPPAMWKKNVMHFGGGSIAYEQEIFRSYLNAYKSTAEGLQWGAEVHGFFKNTSEPIQLDVSDSIQLLINQGVSVMTFFGHASSTGFDQNIDAPENYSNQGKYPLLIGNSCYTGNIHLAAAQSTSERFVLAPNRGVIGFLAKGDLGIPTYLDIYTANFYRHLFQVSYGASIGTCMQRSIADFQSVGDFYEQNVAQTFMFHGDPSIILFPHALPDLSIDIADVILPNSPLAASNETVLVRAVVHNIGKATSESIEVVLRQQTPLGVDTAYVATLNGLLHSDTVQWIVAGLDEVGTHQFSVEVDYPGNAIEELEEAANNVASGIQLQVTDGDIRPVYPYPFAVIDESQPILRASTGFPLEPMRNYRLQVDTTASFDSPLMAEHDIASVGGVIEWPLPFVLQDSMVVFWRCSSIGGDWRWRTASFQYVSNQRGWGMQHRDQFKSIAANGVNYDAQSMNWSFETSSVNLKCEVYGAANSYYENLATRYQLNLDVQEYGGYGYSSPALMVAVLDSATLQPWKSNYAGLAPDFDFGNTLASANARSRQEKYFIFQQSDPVQMIGLANMLNNEIEDGHHLLLYTWQYAIPSAWPNELTEAFDLLGLSTLTAMADSLPFIQYMQMGHSENMEGVIGQNAESFLQLEVDLTGAQGFGILTTPIIGPAMAWEETEWLFGPAGLGTTDSQMIETIGSIPANPTTLDAQIDQWINPGNDIGVIDPMDYSFVQMRTVLSDSAAGTAAQLKRMHVWFDEAPELALKGEDGFYRSADTIAQGNTWSMMMPVGNIGHVQTDSVRVLYYVVDSKGGIHKLPYDRQAPMEAGALLRDTLRIATADLPGLNRLVMIVNPLDSNTMQQDQKEQFYFNNVLELPFFVQADKVPPILEVTADGRHLLDGEIISSRPEILISLRDENRYIWMNELSDTSNFRIYLTNPLQEVMVLRFDDPTIEVALSSNSNVPFHIYYRPTFLRDGMYDLRVQANDKSGNQSGELDYRIHFKVINQASISAMMNYPNPFSTSTRFVFTITGSEVPDDIKIQIMSIGGEVVREIMKDELGPLHIGRNMTEYAWDGRDEFGDQLANGVYFYRTVVRYQNEDMKHLESAADAYFKEGFGKMYLMR